MMFNLLTAVLLIVVVSSTSVLSVSLFDTWVRDFNIYIKNTAHREEVAKKWWLNHIFIEEQNAKGLSYTLGHNQFSGMDIDEYRKYLGQFPNVNSFNVSSITDAATENTVKLADSINWIDLGGVSPVKDQGQCGSCWSFSTTGSMEGAYYVKTGELYRFSEQQLVDCDNLKNNGRDHGCNGGLMDNAFSWISKNGGICTEEAYPYVSGITQTGGACQKTCSVVAKSGVVNFVDVAPSSDSAMMEALLQQPVSVAIEADQREFQLYKSGVFTGECGTNLDHGVLVVGYSTDYYIVKNSWGTTWGDKGYIYLGKGSQYNNGDGQCGLLLQASYPIL
jgi:C1A family cysteine protease